MKAVLILGTQLHRNHPAFKDESVDVIIMIEAQNLCDKLPYHKHKLIFMMSAMRHFAKYAEGTGKKVIVDCSSALYNFQFNFRNKAGKLYPSHIMCDYKKK